MNAEQRIRELGLTLPAPPKPVGAYVQAARTGSLVFTAGQIPTVEGKLTCAGKVPTDVPLEQAQAAARQAALNGLAAIRSLLGSLDGIKRIVRVNCFVNSAPGFTDQAKVANGASELLAEIFGEAGRHSRCAIGAAELPLNAPVELDIIVEVEG
ncbi:MAG TPA: RidA family protein [Phycisphaerae bacterium]|nr:RidA family protein [Phycisphaerae bacterium]